jgi:uridine kinase/Gpi18-like mannosyltransferase
MKLIIKNSIFVYVVIFKIVLAFFFSSEYSDQLFFPFIKSISYENWNPWQTYYENGKLDSFPYHAFMLFLLAPFAFLGELFGYGVFAMKIPLLIADLSILIILIKFFPNNNNKVLFYYFLNPIIIYATYVHTQLDIIPTALLFSSIYFLTGKKTKISSFLFGMAAATKIHVIIAIPLIVFYLYKKFSLVEVTKYFLLSIIVILFFDSPFIFSEGFYHIVINNPKQSLLFDTFYKIESLNLLLPIAIIVLVYFHLFNQNKLNDDLMFFYFGILFTCTIFFIYPSPAWYIWMIPFVSIYFIKNKNQNKSIFLYSLFSLSYIIFFVFFYLSEYKDIYFLGKEIDLKFKNENLRNVSFTILEVSLLTIMYSFYKYGTQSNSIYKKKTNLLIGIGGDSGAGKSTLLSTLKDILGYRLLAIEGDAEHKWERNSSNWDKFTHLDPRANYVHKQADAILQLKQNQSIYRSEYNHNFGKFTKPELVIPKEFIVIAGLHPFYIPKLRKNIDFKIFLDTEESLRRRWKILRDISKRHYVKDKIAEQLERRIADSKKYIAPQKNFADMIITFFPKNDFETGLESTDVNIGLKITFNASIFVEDLIEMLNSNEIIWDYNDDLNSQYIILNNSPLNNFKTLAIDTIENLNEVIDINAKWAEGYNGFLQYLCLKIICEKLKDE